MGIYRCKPANLSRGADFEALDEGALMVLSDQKFTSIVFKLISVQVCAEQACLNDKGSFVGQGPASSTIVEEDGRAKSWPNLTLG